MELNTLSALSALSATGVLDADARQGRDVFYFLRLTLSDPDELTQADLLAASYPSFTFDLSEDTEEQFDLIIPEDVVDGFSRSFDLPTESGRAILLEAVDAFIYGVIARFDLRSQRQDNEALTKVASKAEQLADALLELIDHPNLEAQLEDRIRDFPALAVTRNGLSLPDLIGTRQNVFHDMRDMLVDLQACAELTLNDKPKPKAYLDAFEYEGMPSPQEQFDLDTVEWKRRRFARTLGADYPLHCFLLSILPHWKTHMPMPFSEAKYYKELGSYPSPTISTVKPILTCIDPKLTVQRVAMAVRKIRQEVIE